MLVKTAIFSNCVKMQKALRPRSSCHWQRSGSDTHWVAYFSGIRFGRDLNSAPVEQYTSGPYPVCAIPHFLHYASISAMICKV